MLSEFGQLNHSVYYLKTSRQPLLEVGEGSGGHHSVMKGGGGGGGHSVPKGWGGGGGGDVHAMCCIPH